MQHKQTWIDDLDLVQDPSLIEQSKSEFANLNLEQIADSAVLDSSSPSRRDFLKYLGFGLTAATVAASCEIPIKRAIPYVVKPDEIVPGIANYYASSFVNGGDYCAVLVKTREGRPIKIEGNALSSISKGGTSARTQAYVLSLYDSNRIANPGKVNGDKIDAMSWVDLDKHVASNISANSRIRLVSNTVLSPTQKRVIQEFCSKYPQTKHIQYDPVSSAALLTANEKSFGVRAIPDYRFDNAEVIVSFNADFLGTWISPIEYATQYSSNRKISQLDGAKMSRHIQVECHMSMTGSNADHRIMVKPSEQGAAIAHLYNAVASALGSASITAPALNDKAKTALSKLATSLVAARSKSLIVSSSNNVGEQTLVNALNAILGNIGSTVNFGRVSYQRQGNEAEMQTLISEMNQGNVDAVIVMGANPCYDLPWSEEFKAGLAKTKLSLSTNLILDETTSACQYVAPDHHGLESWGDAEAKKGVYSLIQPTISPLFNSRQSAHSLLVWSNSEKLSATSDQPYYDYLKANWQETILKSTAQSAWDSALHNGTFEAEVSSAAINFAGDINAAAASITKPSASALEIAFYEPINIGNGVYANNPWLQEMPDPVTRTTWGNYLLVPIHFDGDRRFNAMNNVKENGELLEVSVKGNKNTVGAYKAFGQFDGTVAIALGYGRRNAGLTATAVGTDFNNALTVENGLIQYYNTDVEVGTSTGDIEKNFACVQHHHTLGVTAIETSTGKKINADEAELVDDAFKPLTKGYQGSLTDRSIIRRSNLKDLKESAAALHKERAAFQELNSKTLYPGHEYQYNSGHHWGMHVDLNSCTGCGACTVACMAENNVPVVGKKEVSRHHEMPWLRIDRYFYGDVDNPNVVYQPMMCQHCNNAPCENVCPVNATSHSSEGVNQMAYNRCIGTRYCANNCPYKVRRFNWLDYTTADLFPKNEYPFNDKLEIPIYNDNLIRMVLNPDVTVRVRGVIEKCSFCVQRVQEGKLTAKKEGRALTDLDVKSACQTACPTGAITFGDMNNPAGVLAKKFENPLNYVVLEEVNTSPGVRYTMKVINKDEQLDA